MYFVSRRETVFRAPLVRVEPIADFAPTQPVDPRFADGYSFTCRCELVLVEALTVHRLMGWRYLRPEDTPADITDTTTSKPA